MQIRLDKSNVGLYSTKIADKKIIILLLIDMDCWTLWSNSHILIPDMKFEELDFNLLTIVLRLGYRKTHGSIDNFIQKII